MSTPLRIVLINPADEGVSGVHPRHKCYPPLGLLYLAAALEEAGHRVTLVEANAFALDEDAIVDAAIAARPDLLGLPVLVPTERAVRGLIRTLRARGLACPVVLGGPSATTTPARVLRVFEDADYLLRGYAEAGIAALCEALAGRSSLQEVPGLCWRAGEDIQHSERPPAPGDVSRRWRPAKHLVEQAYQDERYFALLERSRPVDSIITSRGCPCGCHYCYNVHAHYQTRAPEDVVEEMVQARARGVRHLELVDDNFTLDRDRAMRIFALMIRERLGLRLVLKSRPERVDHELLARARQAGVYQVSYGMESGVQAILDAMGRGIAVEDNLRAARLTRAAGLYCHTSWIVGYPGETPRTIQQTARVALSMRPTTVTVGILRPYPETRVYLEARAAGTLVGDWSAHDDVEPWVRLPWTSSRRDLERALTRTKLGLYARPRTLLRAGSVLLRGVDRSAPAFALAEVRSLARGLGRRRRNET